MCLVVAQVHCGPLLHQTMTLGQSSAYQGVPLTGRETWRRCDMAQKLFIGGLACSTSTERLREVFAQAGVVESAAVVMDRETGRSRSFGFVEMATGEAAEAAVKKFDGHELDGRRLTVQPAKPAGLGDRSRSSGGERRSRW